MAPLYALKKTKGPVWEETRESNLGVGRIDGASADIIRSILLSFNRLYAIQQMWSCVNDEYCCAQHIEDKKLVMTLVLIFETAIVTSSQLLVDTPNIMLGPSRRLTSAADMSDCPTCTPSVARRGNEFEGKKGGREVRGREGRREGGRRGNKLGGRKGEDFKKVTDILNMISDHILNCAIVLREVEWSWC